MTLQETESSDSFVANSVVASKSATELRDAATRLRCAMHDAALGPLKIAREVCDIGDRWSDFEPVAGQSFASWIQAQTGQQPDFFRRRADAVAFLGEDVRRWMHHEVAVFVANNVTTNHLAEVKRALRAKWSENSKIPVSLAVSRPVVREIVGPGKRRQNRWRRAAEFAIRRARELGYIDFAHEIEGELQ